MFSCFVGLLVLSSAMFCTHIAMGDFGRAVLSGGSAALCAALAMSHRP